MFTSFKIWFSNKPCCNCSRRSTKQGMRSYYCSVCYRLPIFFKNFPTHSSHYYQNKLYCERVTFSEDPIAFMLKNYKLMINNV